MNTKKISAIKYLFPLMILGLLSGRCIGGDDDPPGPIPPATTPPTVPTNVRATATSSTSITVTWGSVSNADSYEVHYQTGSLQITRLTEVSGATSYNHTGLTPNTAYYYYVAAKNSLGTSDLSSRATATTLNETAITVTSVTVSPKAASVEKGKTQSFSATVAGTNSPSQNVTWSIDQTGKHSGTTISTGGLLTVSASESLTTITVRATAAVDASKSDVATVTVATPSLPPAPTGVTAEPTARGTSVIVTWKIVPEATSYKVFYGDENSTNLKYTEIVQKNTFTHSLTARIVSAYPTATKTYYYKVSAINSAGEGPASSVVKVSW